MSLEPAEGEEGPTTAPEPGIVIRGNYHRECSTYPAVEELSRYVDDLPADWKDMSRRIETMMADGDSSR
jgi:hypothetical protein